MRGSIVAAAALLMSTACGDIEKAAISDGRWDCGSEVGLFALFVFAMPLGRGYTLDARCCRWK